MKIDDISKQINVVPQSSESASRATTGRSENLKDESHDILSSGAKIDLSQTSVEYSKVAEAAEKPQPERVGRVNQLKEAVMTGQYQVDSSKVAEKMLMENLSESVRS